jgi:hypothetical protein
MRQVKPTTVAGTISLGQLNLRGLTEGIVTNKLVTAAIYVPALAALISAKDDCAAARGAKRDAQGELDRAVANARVFIPKVVAVMSTMFGRTFSANWRQLGFSRNLSVPGTHAGRQEVLRSTAAYLQTHTAAESASHGVTAAIALGFSTSYDDARGNVQNCLMEVRSTRELRNVKMQAVLKLMTDLLAELSTVLAADDPRWRGFGFNIPADPSVPEAVQNLEVFAETPGALSLDWDASARAERYHVELLVVGTETEFRRVATVYDTDTELTGLTPGATVKVRVIAANAGGESVPSEEVEVQVPALAQAA